MTVVTRGDASFRPQVGKPDEVSQLDAPTGDPVPHFNRENPIQNP
jgi:hypothetical protein